MERNDTGRIKRNRQCSMSAKKLIALILALAMALGMLCATAEDADGLLLPGGTTQASDGELIIGDEASGDSAMDLELPEDAMLGGDALAIDGTSLDGLADNLIADELDIEADAPAEAQASNASDPEDFEIDEDGVLVKYVGAGGDVVIPDGVTSIGERAFSYCESLTSVSIPDGVTSIGKCAFDWCESLASVTIPDSVSTINAYAFCGCSSLTSVTIPDNVASISRAMFNGCSSLTRVTIPEGVTSIDESAFEECSSLTSVIIPNGVTVIRYATFSGCNNLTSITLPNSLTTIECDAFLGCYSLTSVTIPNAVTEIWMNAFIGCSSLMEINVSENNTVFASDDGIVYTHDMKELFLCPEGKSSATIPHGVTGIGNEAFHDCSSLMRVTIPDSVTSIGDRAFEECSSLTNVTIPDSVISIGNWVFYRCENLTSVTIPASVTSIGESVFVARVDEINDNIIPLNVTIYGYKGSYAETYAQENGLAFSALPDPVSLAKAKVTVSAQVYTSKALKPAVKVVLKGKTLKNGADYTVSYKNNKAIGTATVTVKGKGGYTGTAKKTFKINPKAVTGLKLAAGKGKLTVSWKKERWRRRRL